MTSPSPASTTRRRRRLIALFDDVGLLYVAALLRPSWDRFGSRLGAREGFELFCRRYAYEKAGASPDYAIAAERAIAEAGRNRGRDLEPVEVWSIFRRVVGGAVNPKRNPLWHRAGNCDCLLCTFHAETGPRNMVTWARRAVAQDRVADAHAGLKRVRGVGPKIASFFLRDIALRYGLAPKPRSTDSLWVRATAGHRAGLGAAPGFCGWVGAR